MSRSKVIKTCKVDGCERKVIARGLCRNHYQKLWLSHGGQLPPLPPRPQPAPRGNGVCKIEECERPRFGHGLCSRHYSQWRMKSIKENPLDGSKICKKCGEEKRLMDFRHHHGNADGRRSECIECSKQYQKQYRPRIRGAIQRRYSLKKVYGLTVDDYNSMFAEQRGRCAICEVHVDDIPKDKRLCVDHDHGTGRVRALLCGLCNKGLGSFKDDSSRLERAVAYIKRHKE